MLADTDYGWIFKVMQKMYPDFYQDNTQCHLKVSTVQCLENH